MSRYPNQRFSVTCHCHCCGVTLFATYDSTTWNTMYWIQQTHKAVSCHTRHNTTKHKPRTHNYWSTEVRHYLIIIMADQTEMNMLMEEGEGGDEVHEPTTYANNRSSGSQRWNFGVTSWGSTYVSREGSWWKVLQPVARVCVRTGIYCWELKFPAFFVNADYLQRVQTTLCKCMHIILWTSVWQYIVVCC